MMRQGDAAVGMMDAAYFTGRRELLEFFNELLELNLSKIEQTATGAVACQLTEYIYPGSIPMHRVNWEAKSDYEYVQNYKLLQKAFANNNIKRHVDVEKLIKAKYQDNLEFCQWLKAFFDHSGAYREDYDATAVRSKGKGGKNATGILSKNASSFHSKTVPSQARRSRPSSTGPKRPTASSRPASSSSNRSSTTRSSARTASNTKQTTRGKENKSSPSSANGSDPVTDAVLADATLMKKNAELNGKVTELESVVIEVEKERDFYFEKLRDVEVILQVHQERDDDSREYTRMVEKIFKVLYATAEDTVTVGDDGEIVGDEDALGDAPGQKDTFDDDSLTDDPHDVALDELLTDDGDGVGSF
eukprot:CAMPEP_0194059506 /NCGR_PEP_ID=MMETSP0009_2-20130614/69254_1 /TAXON_ID=210454 /ORGANISM="Grammatophora oceanica, Strain CCMP 410" /LENGTH=359 /DNA_ID=CAMNT_0038710093 /DNA_START=1 /DNA_END=1080 /DNA_ORIENTATION=+